MTSRCTKHTNRTPQGHAGSGHPSLAANMMAASTPSLPDLAGTIATIGATMLLLLSASLLPGARRYMQHNTLHFTALVACTFLMAGTVLLLIHVAGGAP